MSKAGGGPGWRKVIIRWSDGQNYDSSEVTQGASEPLPNDDPKVVDYRAKIAQMIMAEVGYSSTQGKPIFRNRSQLSTTWLTAHQGRPILNELPWGYQVRSVKHSTGIHYYVYGHPSNPKAMYRSPRDFFPHCLWLCLKKDEDSSSADCTCKLCSPDHKIGPKKPVAKTSEPQNENGKAAAVTKLPMFWCSNRQTE